MTRRRKHTNVVPFKPRPSLTKSRRRSTLPPSCRRSSGSWRRWTRSNTTASGAPKPPSLASGSRRWTAPSRRRGGCTRNSSSTPQPDPNDLESRLRPILETEGILDLWLHSWDKVMAGEHRNAKLLYLIATTRLFDKCMHAAIKGPSSAGKSEIRKQVLEFFPPEDIIAFITLSEKALLYFESDFCHKILSMAEASGLQEQQLQDMLLRELMSEGKLNYPVAQKIGGQIVTIPIVKNGPVCFMVTTTKAALHPENETRMLSLEIDDSEEQTRRVLKKLAQTSARTSSPTIASITTGRTSSACCASSAIRMSPCHSLTRSPTSSRRGQPASGATTRRSSPASRPMP